MNKLESKYKNPDKYIERLKDEVDEAWASSRRGYRQMGVEVLSYTDTVVHKNSVTSGRLGEFRVNDTVVIVGRVKKVIEEQHRSEIEYGDITIRRKESQ